MPKSFDPNQARRFVGYNLGPNSLQRPSTDDNALSDEKLTRFFNGVHFWCKPDCVYLARMVTKRDNVSRVLDK